MKKNLVIFGWLLLLMPLFIVACGDDDEDDPVTPEPTPQSIVEIATGDNQFSTLVAALQRAELVDILSGDGPFTVFAPTNTAFTNAGITDVDAVDKDVLTEILLYHVLGAEVKSSAINEGQTYVTTAAETGPGDNQLSLLIEKDADGNVSLNGTINVDVADVDATNGVIHIIDNVLMPLDVVGHAAANSLFTSLVGALGTADGDLVNVLSGDGPFTVMAPINDAFTAAQATVDGLSTADLEKVLRYHVASGNVRAADLSDGMMVPSVNDDEPFTINIADGVVTITDADGGVATVLLTDVQGTNGVVHVLDKIIIPGNL